MNALGNQSRRDDIARLPAATKKKVACLCEKMKANVTPKGRR
jgi:hypothetical protein